MKKGTIIAVVALVVVLIAFFATRKEVTTTVEAPYVVKAVKDLSRIELTRPGNELVVLEKTDAGWTLTKPVNAPLADNVVGELDAMFASDIRTDDIKLSKDKADDYELTDKGTRVALFAADGQNPVVQFTVGKQVTVEGTRVSRSFIMNDKDRPFRAQKSLELLRSPVNDLRSKVITTADRTKVTHIKVTRADGSVELSSSDGTWTMTSPEPGMPLETSVVDAMASAIANLRAVDFADDKQPSEVGLEPPLATAEFKVGDSTVTIDVGNIDKDWYARIPGEPFIYKISTVAGQNLSSDVNALRNRVPVNIDSAQITAVEFPGTQKVSAIKNGETWTMVRPSKETIKDDKMSMRLSALATLRVSRFVANSPVEAGITKSKDVLVVKTASGKHTLVFGDKVEGSEDRYAKWDSDPHVFVLPKYLVERLMPAAKDLTDS
ncbi:MAG: DUF4340 domain-containing protein [bacterium]